MDNRINQIRRKIVTLRAAMLALQDDIRREVNDDLDCLASCQTLMTMRLQMIELIRLRDAMGGFEARPDIAERLRENRRVLGKRGPLKKTRTTFEISRGQWSMQSSH
jgi:hypothetical protein